MPFDPGARLTGGDADEFQTQRPGFRQAIRNPRHERLRIYLALIALAAGGGHLPAIQVISGQILQVPEGVEAARAPADVTRPAGKVQFHSVRPEYILPGLVIGCPGVEDHPVEIEYYGVDQPPARVTGDTGGTLVVVV